MSSMTSTLTPPRTSRARGSEQVHRVTTARPARRPVRLTRRGRLLMLVALVALAFSLASLGRVAGWASGPDDGAGAGSGGGRVATQWVVQPGESLWQVALWVTPDSDPRDTVARIVELNDLETTTVTAGQTLLVPA